MQWIGFHEGVLRQLRLLLCQWGDAAPKPPPDLVGARVAPDAAIRQLKQLSGEFRLCAEQWRSDEARQRSWRALCELLIIAAGYEAALITALCADVLRSVRIEARPGAPVPLCVPVIGSDGSSELAHLRVTVVPDQSGVTFEPPGAFDARAKDAAQAANQEAWGVAGSRRPARPVIRFELSHPDGICVEGASLGPAVHAAAAVAFRGEWTAALEDSIVLAGVLELGANGPALARWAHHAAAGEARRYAPPTRSWCAAPRGMAVSSEWTSREAPGRRDGRALASSDSGCPRRAGRVATVLTDARRAVGVLGVIVRSVLALLRSMRAAPEARHRLGDACNRQRDRRSSTGGPDGARGDVRGIGQSTTSDVGGGDGTPPFGRTVPYSGIYRSARVARVDMRSRNRSAPSVRRTQSLAPPRLPYAIDHDQRLPRAGTWSAGTVIYTGET